MRVLERGAPAAAIVAALSAHICCVPVGLLGAIGIASVRLWIPPLRFWLLGASVVLLCVECGRLYFSRSASIRRSLTSVVLFWASVTVVVFTAHFPQVISKLMSH
jgi:hypothetical protein